MILGYRAPPGETPYYFGKVDGVEKKFRRVIAGIILPVFDRQQAAVVMIGEQFKISGPQVFVGLEITVDYWPQVERALLEYDKRLQFRDAIVPTKAERMLLWRIGLSTHVLTWQAPDWALTDVGRQKVDQLIAEDRLHLDTQFQSSMSHDPELSSKALQTAVIYALDWNPPYITKSRMSVYQMQPIGTKGL